MNTYLHNFYIALGFISNLGKTLSMWEDVFKLYAKNYDEIRITRKYFHCFIKDGTRGQSWPSASHSGRLEAGLPGCGEQKTPALARRQN